jgi:hypothetical protein
VGAHQLLFRGVSLSIEYLQRRSIAYKICRVGLWETMLVFFGQREKRIEVMIRINEFVVAAILGEK